MKDNVCPNGPSCPNVHCRREREARGLALAPPVVNTKDCWHGILAVRWTRTNDPVFPFTCLDCGRVFAEDIFSEQGVPTHA
jgi:hypothetical protein